MRFRVGIFMESNTRLKLKDAATQLQLAVAHIADEATFRSCINAFIDSGRSVTFVMQTESSGNQWLQAWYEKEMDRLKKTPLFRFFNEQRIQTVHRASIKPRQLSSPIRELAVGGKALPGIGEMSVWIFDDIEQWMPGSSGNVIRLCETYWQQLADLTARWERQRLAGSI